MKLKTALILLNKPRTETQMSAAAMRHRIIVIEDNSVIEDIE